MKKGNSEYEMLVRQREEFLSAEVALFTINGMAGMVAHKLRDRVGLTRDRQSELESQMKLLSMERHLLYCGDMAVTKKALEEYSPNLEGFHAER
ncbi:MAG: hypothetical protein LBT40_11285 [Deltaproteobacteria bacterium]|jgi:hypothetical protein|nr:hypothetical protein [Deltaproteobacteria bacterium]